MQVRAPLVSIDVFQGAANSSEVSQQFLDGSFHDSMTGWSVRYCELLCDISGLAISIYHVTGESWTSVRSEEFWCAKIAREKF